MDENVQQRVEELQKKKEGLVVKYLKLQDQADYYNEEIYKVCCEIEEINLEIAVAKENRIKNNGVKSSNYEQKRRITG